MPAGTPEIPSLGRRLHRVVGHPTGHNVATPQRGFVRVTRYALLRSPTPAHTHTCNTPILQQHVC